MPSSNCISPPRWASASPRRAPSLTRKRASPGSPGTRYFSIPSHSSNQSAGPTCASAMPTVYSGVLFIGQLSRWSLLNITSTSGRAASSRRRISAVAPSASCWYSSDARSNQPVRPGECVMAMAATIWATVSSARAVPGRPSSRAALAAPAPSPSLRGRRACSTRGRRWRCCSARRRRRGAGSAARSTGGRRGPSGAGGPSPAPRRPPRGSARTRARGPRNQSASARAAARRGARGTSSRSAAASCRSARRYPLSCEGGYAPLGLPRRRSLEHLRIHLQKHDHAALGAEVAHVVRHVLRELHDGARRHHDLAAVDGHVRRALEHEDRLLLLRMAVHHGGLTGLVAGDLRPELVGLEEHLPHALVGGERFQRVQVEHLRDARGGGDGDLLVHGASCGCLVYRGPSNPRAAARHLYGWEAKTMMQALIAPVVLATLVGLWLAWLKRRERAGDRALTVRAEIQSAVNRALEGESLLAVQVEPPSSFHRGRVVLSTPTGYEWLVHEAWNPVIEHAPKDYEVVLRHVA